jgi:hypothetical protein
VLVHSNFIIYRQPSSFAAQSENEARGDGSLISVPQRTPWGGEARRKAPFVCLPKVAKVTQKEEKFPKEKHFWLLSEINVEKGRKGSSQQEIYGNL